MPQLQPQIGELYRHFKGQLYQITNLAVHSETGERMVVYQALYGDYRTYVRPYDQFVGEVDVEKYPECPYRSRFTYVPREERPDSRVAPASAAMQEIEPAEGNWDKEPQGGDAPSRSLREQSMQELMLTFLDERDFLEKEKILSEIATRPELSDGLIDNLAAALDVVIDEGPIDRRFASLRTCVRTRARFENTRLRG